MTKEAEGPRSGGTSAREQESLDSVVISFRNGASAETIRDQYPTLSLEQVYGAIAYYLGHMDEVDRYLEQQDQVWEHWHKPSEKDPAPAIARLQAIRRSQASRPS